MVDNRCRIIIQNLCAIGGFGKGTTRIPIHIHWRKVKLHHTIGITGRHGLCSKPVSPKPDHNSRFSSDRNNRVLDWVAGKKNKRNNIPCFGSLGVGFVTGCHGNTFYNTFFFPFINQQLITAGRADTFIAGKIIYSCREHRRCTGSKVLGFLKLILAKCNYNWITNIILANCYRRSNFKRITAVKTD